MASGAGEPARLTSLIWRNSVRTSQAFLTPTQARGNFGVPSAVFQTNGDLKRVNPGEVKAPAESARVRFTKIS
jgi:hypothetical protein